MKDYVIASMLVLLLSAAAQSQIWHSTIGPRPLKIDSTRALVKPVIKQDATTFAAFLTSISDHVVVENPHYHLEDFLVCSLKTVESYESFLDSLRDNEQIAMVEPYYLTESGTPFLIGESFCVVFEPAVSRGEIDELNRKYGVTIDYVFGGRGNVMTLKNSRGSGLTTLEMANLYHDLSQTEIAHPNFEVKHSYLTPYRLWDYYNQYQWHLKKIIGNFNSATVWDFAGLTDSVIVAVVDDGVEEHEDLPASRILQGYDFGDYDTDASPPPDSTGSHGQACAGIIGASHTLDSIAGLDASTGVISLSGYVRILPIKLVRDDHTIQGLPLDRFGRAIDTAWQMGAEVICCAWCFLPPWDTVASITVPISSACDNAIAYGRNGLGTPIMFGAGNTGADHLVFPSSLSVVFSPGAVDADDERWQYSNYSLYGKQLDLVTPSGGLGGQGDLWTLDLMGDLGWNYTVGVDESMRQEPSDGWDSVDVWECPPGEDNLDYFCSFGGTSASTAITAGVAALLIARNPELCAYVWCYPDSGIYSILRGSAVPLTANVPDTAYGWGRIDAFRAILSIARGDANNSGTLSISDIQYLNNYKYLGGPAPWPDSLLGDVNCTGTVTISDIQMLVDHLYVSRNPLPLPCFEFND